MQHNDDGTRNGVRRLNRTQRSARQKDYSARGNADEVSGCKRVVEREAHRTVINPGEQVTAEHLIGLLPDPIITHLSVDEVCRQTLFLANLVSSPYVKVA